MVKGTGQVRPGIVPMPVVHVAGLEVGDPRAAAIIDRYLGKIRQFVNEQRQTYALSLGEIAPRGRRVFDDVSMMYDNVQGTETITIIPRTPEPSPPSGERPARWLILEFLWVNDRDGDPIPYIYASGYVPWNLVLVDVPGVAVGEGTFAFGETLINQASAPQDVEALPGFLGKAGRKEVIYHSTSEDLLYKQDLGYAAYGGTVRGMMDYDPTGTSDPNDSGGWQLYGVPDLWYDAPGGGGTNARRYKGIKELHPHLLYPRVNQALEEDEGQGVGINPEGVDPWDDYVYDFQDETFKFYGGPRTESGYAYTSDNDRAEVNAVRIDLRKYEKRYGPILKVQCTGFWRSARNFVHPVNAGPDEGFEPQRWFSIFEEAYAYMQGLGTITDSEAWSRVQENIPPHPAELRATLLWGPEDFDDYLDDKVDKSHEVTKTLYTKTVRASQPNTNVASAPDVLPWGDIFGTVTLDIRQSLLGFTKDK
jgi:hypothetical protein